MNKKWKFGLFLAVGALAGALIAVVGQRGLLEDLGPFQARKSASSSENSEEAKNEAEKNRIKNGGFNSDLKGWHSRRSPDAFSWSGNQENTSEGVLAVHSEPPEDAREGIIYEAELSQCVPLENGRRYRLSARFKSRSSSESPHANRVNLYWYQSRDCTSGGEYETYLEPETGKNDWQSLSREGLLRAMDARSARISINQNRREGDTHLVFWDDIALVPTRFEQPKPAAARNLNRPTPPAGTNYLDNGNFDSDIEDWWHTGDTEWVSSTGFREPGAARLAIQSDSGGYGAHSFYQCVQLGADRSFKAGARVKVDPSSTQKGGARFRFLWYEKDECRGRSKYGSGDELEAVKGWQELTIGDIEAPGQARSARISFTRGVDDTGSFAYFIDDVFFRSVPDGSGSGPEPVVDATIHKVVTQGPATYEGHKKRAVLSYGETGFPFLTVEALDVRMGETEVLFSREIELFGEQENPCPPAEQFCADLADLEWDGDRLRYRLSWPSGTMSCAALVDRSSGVDVSCTRQ